MASANVGPTHPPLAPLDERSSDCYSSDGESSTNSNEALLEMLGLSASDLRDDSLRTAVDDDGGGGGDEAKERAVADGTATAKKTADERRGFEGTGTITDEEAREEEAAAARRSVIATRTLAVPRRCSRYLHPPERCAAFVVDDLLSVPQCRSLIELASKSNGGFRYVTEASHPSPDGRTTVGVVTLQNPNPHKLSVFESRIAIANIWDSLRGRIDTRIGEFRERTGCGPPLGLNPRIRVLRYDAGDGDRFEPHFDATTTSGPERRSLLTVLVYLNGGGGVAFGGGETLYLDSIKPIMSGATRVIPSTGRAVIFEHDLYHSSACLEWGTKFVLRTDVMFAARDDPLGDVAVSSCEAEGQPPPPPNSLSDICFRLDLPGWKRQVLEDMGMLDMTVESFLAPGVAMLKLMLTDQIGGDIADILITEALEIAKEVRI